MSVDITVLLPDAPTALHEESNVEDGECDSEILSLVREYKEIKSHESRKAVRSLIRSLTSSKG